MLTNDCTDYIEGEWVEPTPDSTPWARAWFEYDSEGFYWWAMGEEGNATSIDDARAQALAALERFAAKRVEGG